MPAPHKKSPAPPRTLWSKFPLKTSHRWLNLLLLFMPVAIILDLLHVSPLLIFITSALAIAPLASVLGESTGALSSQSGPAIGGILSATMGNATEMIIAFFALRAGHINVVKASLSGSIIGNLLLVLGLSLVAGGLRNPVQRFSRTTSSMNSTTLMIAVAALVMPADFNLTLFGTLQPVVVMLKHLCLWTSGVLIALYLLNLLFVFRTHHASFAAQHQQEEDAPRTSRTQAIDSIATAAVLIAGLNELLLDHITPVTRALSS